MVVVPPYASDLKLVRGPINCSAAIRQPLRNVTFTRPPKGGIERGKYGWVLSKAPDSQHADGNKPHRHDGSEHLSDALRSARLDERQKDENANREGHD
jgi:hypothetical protein